MDARFWISWGGLGILALIHLFAGKLRFLHVIPRSIWLSFGSGVSISYIFLHLLPEISKYQSEIQGTWFPSVGLEYPLFLTSAIGLIVYYGLELFVLKQIKNRKQKSKGVFWIHILSFALYNFLIGCLSFQTEEKSLSSYLLTIFALGWHFLVNDFGLSDHHEEEYRQKGRWVMSMAVLGGGILGITSKISGDIAGLAVAFLAGGIILNILKEELPAERKSRFLPLVAGFLVYMGLHFLFSN